MNDLEHMERLRKMAGWQAGCRYGADGGGIPSEAIEAIAWAVRTIEEQAEEIKRLREALEPFAQIGRASTGMLEPHMMMHSPDWYRNAQRALKPKAGVATDA